MLEALLKLTESMELEISNEQREELVKDPDYVLKLIKALNDLTAMADFAFTELQLVLNSLIKSENRPHLETIVFAIRTLVSATAPTLDKDQIDSLYQHLNMWKIMATLPNPVYVAQKMQAFTRGLGKISYNDSLLVLAERKQRKTYEFNPTVLTNYEFLFYLLAIRSSLYPLHERFIIAAGHWLAGEIEINEQGKIKIVLLDSSGRALPSELNQTVAAIERIFGELPRRIDFDPQITQGGPLGCSVYALDNVSHLFTLGKYLPKKYKGNLFNYLADHPSKEFETTTKDGKPAVLEKSPAAVTLVSLPLSLMRTNMLTGTFPEILSKKHPEEISGPTNKRGETFEEVIKREQAYDPARGKMVNARLKNKLEKMAQHVFTYLSTHSPAEVEKDSQQFTLNAFIARKEKELMQAGPLFLPNQQGLIPFLIALNNDNINLAIRMLETIPAEKLLSLDKNILDAFLNKSSLFIEHINLSPQPQNDLLDKIFLLHQFYLEQSLLDFNQLYDLLKLLPNRQVYGFLRNFTSPNKVRRLIPSPNFLDSVLELLSPADCLDFLTQYLGVEHVRKLTKNVSFLTLFLEKISSPQRRDFLFALFEDPNLKTRIFSSKAPIQGVCDLLTKEDSTEFLNHLGADFVAALEQREEKSSSIPQPGGQRPSFFASPEDSQENTPATSQPTQHRGTGK